MGGLPAPSLFHYPLRLRPIVQPGRHSQLSYFSLVAVCCANRRECDNAALLQRHLNRKIFPRYKAGWSDPILGGFGADLCIFSHRHISALPGAKAYSRHLYEERTLRRMFVLCPTFNLPVYLQLCVRQPYIVGAPRLSTFNPRFAGTREKG